MIHLYFNIIGVVVWLSVFYLVNGIFSVFPVGNSINAWGVAAVHTVFKIVSVIIMAPFYRQLEKLAVLTVREKTSEEDKANQLDERLIATPTVAVEQATRVTYKMADVAFGAFAKSLIAYENYSVKLADEIHDLEGKADKFEDDLGSYLVKISACDLSRSDAAQVTKLLHIIGDLERISDHAVNIVESAEEMQDKKLSFSAEAKREIGIMMMALSEIIGITKRAFVENDVSLALKIEPLEEAIDELRDEIKLNHVIRLQKSECTIEHGFILNDILTNFERVSDHCSNIGSCVVEVSEYDDFEMHKYKNEVKGDKAHFEEQVSVYRSKYNIALGKGE
jgi:phosphate:Na+ symporter